ncbi:MAG: hypothetical protein HQK89_10445 [Nitrospirae bacterium]|nr:hypothetical protein [Nitrospirota bacterium]
MRYLREILGRTRYDREFWLSVLRNRVALTGLGFFLAIVTAILLAGMLGGREARLEKSRLSIAEFNATLKDYAALNGEFMDIKKKVNGKEANGAIQSLGDVLQSVGLKDRQASIKSMGQKKLSGYEEDSAEFKLQNVTLNEVVNLLYRIENGRVGFFIKGFRMKKSFNGQDKFDVALELSCVRERGQTDGGEPISQGRPATPVLKGVSDPRLKGVSDTGLKGVSDPRLKGVR